MRLCALSCSIANAHPCMISHLNEDFERSAREEIPFLEVIVVPDAEMTMISSSGIIMERLEVNIQEITVSVDFNFIVQLVVSAMSGGMRNSLILLDHIRSRLKMDDVSKTHSMLIHSVKAPDFHRYNSRMLYLKTFEVHAIDIKLRLNIDLANVSARRLVYELFSLSWCYIGVVCLWHRHQRGP